MSDKLKRKEYIVYFYKNYEIDAVSENSFTLLGLPSEVWVRDSLNKLKIKCPRNIMIEHDETIIWVNKKQNDDFIPFCDFVEKQDNYVY
jgi:hypothetical protein